MGIGDAWRRLVGGQDKAVPANQVIPRMRDSSGPHPVVPATPQPSLREATPFANQVLPTPVPPPEWSAVFPAHHRALLADLTRRGEDPSRWCIVDGIDQGVSEHGHTVRFILEKTGTQVRIEAELTLFKGQLASVRVR